MCLFGIFSLVLQVQNLHEALGHVVRFLCAAIIVLEVHQEAEEDCVHCHGVHGEEAGGYEVGTWGG